MSKKICQASPGPIHTKAPTAGLLRALFAGALSLAFLLPVHAAEVMMWLDREPPYLAPATVTVSKTCVLDEGESPVRTATFYHNGTLLPWNGCFSPPYTLQNLPRGRHNIEARAVDQNGRTLPPVDLWFDVTIPGDNPPTATLASPSGSPFIAPGTVSLAASASDSDGQVTKVEFLANNAVIGSDTSAPYQFTWNNVAAGTHTLTARATDNNGKTGISAPRQVIVQPSQIVGNVDGVSLDGTDQYRVTGWACSTGHDASIQVHIYVGGGAGSGTDTGIGSILANRTSEPQVAAACSAQGTAYRFLFNLSSSVRSAHANKKIYVHGISPFGNPNYAINNSGRYSVPGLELLTRRYHYDNYQRLCRTVEPETSSAVVDYDSAGNIVWSASGLNLPSANGCYRTEALASDVVISRTYDHLGRLETLNFPDTRGNQTWDYTLDGLPERVTTVNVPDTVHPQNHYVYNARRMPVTETQHLPAWYSFSLGYEYNANGHLKKLFYPSGQSVDFAPNALGQATKVMGGTGHTFASEVSYHPNGAIERFKYGNGIVHTMIPNDRQLPRFVKDAGVLDMDYRYDNNGNVDRVFDNIRAAWGNRHMDYDGLDRLTHIGFAQLGGNHHMYFTYDARDNLKTWKHPAAGGAGMIRDHLYCYNSKNQLEFIRSDATACNNGSAVDYFQYDVQGNVQLHDNIAFDFDYGNRLREILGKERYRYDAHGRRILANNFITGTITSQYGGNGQLLYQKNARTGQNKEIDHIYLGGSLIAQREASLDTGAASAKYIHTDALGSPVAVTDQSGTMVGDIVDYEPYGRQLDGSTIIGRDRPGYTGHVLDVVTGLNYMQQRYYDPQIGRFLSVDPVTAYENPIGAFNRYWYANNNPYRFTDPDGRQSVGEMIDSGAEGCGPVSCAGWAALNATWQVFGAEGVSQIADKGWSNAGAGSRAGAGWEAAAVIPFAKVARTGTVLIGSAQRTTRAGMASGHAFRQLREAAAMLRTGGYEKISLHRSLRTLTDGAVNSRLKPDVAGLRPDGKIDITEVLSPGQKAADLQAKYAGALGDRMGDFKAVEATKVMCTGSRIAQTSC